MARRDTPRCADVAGGRSGAGKGGETGGYFGSHGGGSKVSGEVRNAPGEESGRYCVGSSAMLVDGRAALAELRRPHRGVGRAGRALPPCVTSPGVMSVGQIS